MYAALVNEELVLAVDAKYDRNIGEYICPKCGKMLQLICGSQATPYFRHNSVVVRSSETIEHYYGKKTIKTALDALGLDAKLEVPIADDQLRADVLVTTKDRQIGIEFQCATLSKREYTLRHSLYEESKITDLWVLGKRHFMKNHIKAIHLLAMQYFYYWGDYIIELDILKNKIRLRYNIQQNDLTKFARCQTQTFSFDEYGIKKLLLFKPDKVKKYRVEQYQAREELERQIIRQTKLGRKVAEECYLRHIDITDIPDEYFVGYREAGIECQLLEMLRQN